MSYNYNKVAGGVMVIGLENRNKDLSSISDWGCLCKWPWERHESMSSPTSIMSCIQKVSRLKLYLPKKK